MSDDSLNNLNKQENINRLMEIAKVFAKLGIFAFGGPAAHIAMMDEEIVKKREWISREKFMDLIGATNLIPGPNSTELAIHLGYERGGVLGLFVAGVAFILPAMLIVMLFAYFYERYGSLPQVSSVLYGMKPVIIAIILQALYRLGKSVIKDKLSIALGFVGLSLSLFLSEIPLLFLCGTVMMLYVNRDKFKSKIYSISLLPLSTILFTFIKIGAVLYGSGYVLLAFIEAEFVEKLGVLSSQQLLDSVAAGQITPGPVFTTATFVGYLLNGFSGAVVATIGIFLPSFLLVWAITPIVTRLRNSPYISAALDGINIASFVLMTVVSFKLGVASIIDGFTVILFVVSLTVLIKTKINSAWIMLVGGLVGWMGNLIS